MKNTKLTKTAATIERITRVVRNILGAAAWVVLIFAALTFILGEKIVQPQSLTIDLDLIRLTPTEGYLTFTPGMKYFTALGLAGSAVVCFMIHYGAGLLLNIFGRTKEGRPFEEGTVRALRKLAWLVLVGGTAAEILRVGQQAALAAAFPLTELFSREAVAHIQYNFTLDGGYLVLFALLLLLSYIFSYGQALQQDVDDTV